MAVTSQEKVSLLSKIYFYWVRALVILIDAAHTAALVSQAAVSLLAKKHPYLFKALAAIITLSLAVLALYAFMILGKQSSGAAYFFACTAVAGAGISCLRTFFLCLIKSFRLKFADLEGLFLIIESPLLLGIPLFFLFAWDMPIALLVGAVASLLTKASSGLLMMLRSAADTAD